MDFRPKLAPRTGLEPVTSKLTASCSTIELPGNEYIIAQIRILKRRKAKSRGEGGFYSFNLVWCSVRRFSFLYHKYTALMLVSIVILALMKICQGDCQSSNSNIVASPGR